MGKVEIKPVAMNGFNVEPSCANCVSCRYITGTENAYSCIRGGFVGAVSGFGQICEEWRPSKQDLRIAIERYSKRPERSIIRNGVDLMNHPWLR